MGVYVGIALIPTASGWVQVVTGFSGGIVIIVVLPSLPTDSDAGHFRYHPCPTVPYDCMVIPPVYQTQTDHIPGQLLHRGQLCGH